MNSKVLDYEHPSNELARITAINLAKALENKDVRVFLKTRILETFDGDYNFLIGKMANSEIKGKPFAEVLYGDNKASALSKIIDSYPLLQIAMPELSHVSPEQWDTDVDVPLVAIKPIGYNDEQGMILAYNSKGNVLYLDSEIEPDNLVLVRGANERLRGIAKKDNVSAREVICAEVVYSDPNYNYYLNESLADPCDPPPLPGGGDPTDPPPTCTCDRDCKVSPEKLFKLKFVNISQLRAVEKWLSGKVELRIAMVYNAKGKAAYFDTAYTGKRSDFRDCNIWGNCTTKWKTLNRTFTEFQTGYGDRIKIAMFEEDDQFPVTYKTTSTVWISSNIDGFLHTHAAEIDINSKHDDLGDVEVLYCDNADSPGKWYSNSFIEFYWGQN